jgi:hypothetical protein
MFPCFVMYYFTNVRLMHTEFLRQFYLRSAILIRISNCLNDVFGQLPVEHFSFRLSVFRNFIGDVVRVGSKKKVCWIYAARVIAFVKNMDAVWNWTGVEFVGETGG